MEDFAEKDKKEFAEKSKSNTGLDRFTFFLSYWETAKKLKTGSARLAFYDAIMNFVFEGIDTDFDEIADVKLEALKTIEDRAEFQKLVTEISDYGKVLGAWIQTKPYIISSAKRILDGKKGGRPKKEKDTL